MVSGTGLQFLSWAGYSQVQMFMFEEKDLHDK